MAGFVGVRAQDRGETTWLSAVSHDTSLLNLDEVSLGSGVYSISKPALMNAQKQDPIIGRVLIFKETGKWPSTWEKKRELPATRVLLRQRCKLYQDKDGLLYRKSGPFSQLVLPQKFHTTVFKELHQEMGHLGAPRVIQLARERFYWPNMENDIIHFVTKICSCLLNSGNLICLHVHHATVSPPQCQLTSYIWSKVLVAMSTSWLLLTILPDSHRHIQLRISRAQSQLIAYIMTLSCDLVSQQRSFMIKDESLRINYFTDYTI